MLIWTGESQSLSEWSLLEPYSYCLNSADIIAAFKAAVRVALRAQQLSEKLSELMSEVIQLTDPLSECNEANFDLQVSSADG
jgi:hypothetical protein